MKKIFILLFVVLLTSCSAPIVKNIESSLPEGYTKGYYIEDRFQTRSDTMNDFVIKFSSDSDCIIKIDDYTYLVLRK